MRKPQHHEADQALQAELGDDPAVACMHHHGVEKRVRLNPRPGVKRDHRGDDVGDSDNVVENDEAPGDPGLPHGCSGAARILPQLLAAF